MGKHRLIELEEDFLVDGVKAICICGWKSKRCRDDQEALHEIRRHQSDEQDEQP